MKALAVFVAFISFCAPAFAAGTQADYDAAVLNNTADGLRLFLLRGCTEKAPIVRAVVCNPADLAIYRCGQVYVLYWKRAPGNRPMEEYFVTAALIFFLPDKSLAEWYAQQRLDDALYRHREEIRPLKIWN